MLSHSLGTTYACSAADDLIDHRCCASLMKHIRRLLVVPLLDFPGCNLTLVILCFFF